MLCYAIKCDVLGTCRTVTLHRPGEIGVVLNYKKAQLRGSGRGYSVVVEEIIYVHTHMYTCEHTHTHTLVYVYERLFLGVYLVI